MPDEQLNELRDENLQQLHAPDCAEILTPPNEAPLQDQSASDSLGDSQRRSSAAEASVDLRWSPGFGPSHSSAPARSAETFIEVPSVKVLPATSTAMPSVRASSRNSAARAASDADAAGAVSSDSDALRILLQASAAAESLQQRFAELNQQRAEIVAEHQQLDADRLAFENRAREFATQVAKDRTAQRELQAELDQRVQKVASQEELLERQTSELQAARRALNEERVLLKQALKAELEDERARIEQQTRLLDTERKQVQDRNERDRVEHAERMQQLDAELETERKRLVDKVREEMASELAQLNREKQEWQEKREQQRLEIQQQSEDLQQQREVFGEQLQTEQARLREEVEKRRQMLLTEQSNLQRRYRFQFEHLGRAREDLEFEVRELRREQQMFRNERLRFTEQHRMRFRQLERVRVLLSDAEASLVRETRIVERSRAAALSDVERMQRRAEEEREAINQDLETRQRRIRQQEASLADLASRLDDRSQRLGGLRAELDKTQGEILEQRLAIEEAKMSLFKDSTQSEAARARLEQARGDVQSFFDRLKTQINVERDKIEAASSGLAERQAQFRRDRTELEQWFLDREAAMNNRTTESVVLELQQTIEQQQTQLHDLQERWKADRREAERTIRDLLDQLTTAEMNAFSTPVPRRPSQTSDTATEGVDSSSETRRDAA